MASFLKSILATTIGMVIGTVLIVFLGLGIFGVVIHGASKAGESQTIEKNSILHLRMRGVLVDKHRSLDFDFSGPHSIFKEDRTMGLWEISKAIDAAKTDKRISGLYLELRDFQSGWANLSALHRKIEEFKATGKWVYAYADKFDEHSYYLATAANQIFIQPNGDIEINGLGVNEAFLKGLFEKVEVEPRVFRVGKFKAAVEPFILERMSAENREQTKALLDDVWATIKEATTASTKLTGERIDQIAAGLEVTSAAEAKAAGLVNEMIFEDDLEDKMKNFTVGPNAEMKMVSVSQLLRDRKAMDLIKRSGKKKIAVIFAEGEINSGMGSNDSIGSEGLSEDLHDVEGDDDVAALVLRVNSPGGDALASDVLWREITVLDEKIPVVISMGDVAASGGYYISAAGRYVFAENTTITGSIGVFGLMFNTQKLFNNRAGVKFDRVATHPYAGIGDSNRPMAPLEAQTIQKEVERVYKRFIDVVTESRGYDKREEVEGIAEGRVWSGKRAIDLGLVDEIGGLDQAIAKAADYAKLGANYQVEVFPKDSDAISQFLEKLTGDSIETAVGRDTISKIKALSSHIPESLVNAKDATMKAGVYARLPMDLEIH